MICYKDKTFCSAPCRTESCNRNLNEKVYAEARAWWRGDNPPICVSDLSEGCRYFLPLEEKTDEQESK